MIRILLLLLFILTASLQSFAQRETDNWYFGQNASLEFNAAGVPVSFQNSAMNAPVGSASISDKAGNLLFYTDGETVWNRLHQVMANGTGLAGSKQGDQPAIIIPKPGNTSLYYVFTKLKSGITNPLLSNLNYSEVDISANNGMGEVLNATKNTPLLGLSAGIHNKITAVHHANGQDIWVITIRDTPNMRHDFAALKITATGIDPNPVTNTIPAGFNFNTGGVLKASPTGKHLAATFGSTGAGILDFDDKTGQISNFRILITPGPSASRAEFSPDGSKVYFTGDIECLQFNLISGNTAAIIASKTIVAPASTGIFGIQLASNGKIYLAKNHTAQLLEIATPNAAGVACNFRNSLTLVSPSVPRFGLPNFIQSYFAPPRFEYTGLCAGSPISFTIPNQTNIDSVRWNFGDPNSTQANTSTALQTSHIFNTAGAYSVQLNIYQQGFHSVFERIVTILNKPLVQLPKDTSVCEGTTVFVMNSYPTNPFNERFLWSTGNTDSTILRITKPGIYWLELTNGVCTTRDSIVVQYRPKPKVNLGGNRTQCGNAPILLDAGNPGARYLWQPNKETTQTISVSKPGVYSVTVTSNRCSTTDVVSINFNETPGFDFGGDISVCEGEPVVLKTVPKVPGVFYNWNDSTNLPELTVKKSGKYWATINQNGCLFTDTVNVTFRSCPPPIVPYIPNIISPNNDNRNDKFVIEKIPLNAWDLKIYNRWGKQIYHNERYSNNWPEKEMMNGTYYYLLEEPETGRKFKGWLEVVR